MRVGYVFVPFFPIAVERRRVPDLADKPAIVGGYSYERKPVFAASAECVEAGVQVGMPLRQAYMLCPEAVFLAVDSEAYAAGYEELLVVLDSFSPAVEKDDLGAAYIDADGLTLLFGEERELGRRIIEAVRGRLGMSARVAFGPGRLAARVAARLAPIHLVDYNVSGLAPDAGVVVIKMGGTAEFLRDLSVGWLGLGESSGDRLRMLGIRTIGQFMRLPAGSLLEQFGPGAAAVRRVIDGEERDVVVPRPEPIFLDRSVALDFPVETMGGFSLLARDLVAFLVADLRRRHLACQMVALRVELENGSFQESSAQLKEPADAEGDLLQALEKLAWRMRGDAGIVSVRVALGGLVPPISRQMGFFDAQRRRRVCLDGALDEIKGR